MTKDLKNIVQNFISYYKEHDMTKMILTDQKGFVTDDFQALLLKLEKELEPDERGCAYECEDCENMFLSNEGRPYKYEPEVWLCDDCEDKRMEDL